MRLANEHVVRLNEVLQYKGIITDAVLKQLTDEQTFTNWMLCVDLVATSTNDAPPLP